MIDLQLFGGLAVHSPVTSGAPSPLPRRRALALVAAVAAAGPQPVARDKLLALLWPESDAVRARNSLRQAMFALRRDLHEDLFLPETPSGLQLDPAHLRVDLCRFRDALGRDAFDEAVAVYRGPFLDGFHVPGLSTFSLWVDAERARLERQYLAAIDALAQRAERDGRTDDVVLWRRRHAAADPLSSRGALALLKALAAAGDRAGAIQYAASHERLIWQELEIEPDAEVTEFVSSLRRDASVLVSSPRATPSEPLASVVPPADIPLEELAAAVPPTPIAVVTRSRFPSARWFAVSAVVLLAGTLIAGRWVTAAASLRPSATPPILLLGTGMHPVAGRDPDIRLVACHGPACPSGPLPQDAYVVAANPAYTPPAAGTYYIAPVPDGTTKQAPGYACCTTATFEATFPLPVDATSATITVSALADNQAILSMNGVEFGRQTDSLAVDNFGDPARFTTTFAPDPSGVNHLRVTLWDGGGALGLQYVATVTHETRAQSHR